MEQQPSPMTPTAPIEPRHWRRGLAKAVRRPVRAVLRYRPSPIVGALLLGAVIGGGLTAITVGLVTDHAPTDQAVISQSLTGRSPSANDNPWDRFGDHHGMRGMNGHG